MSEPMLQRPLHVVPDDRRADGASDAPRRAPRPVMDDPLEELARILGEGYPARPETAAETTRRGVAGRPMPQQLSALEAELFDELRASVTPEARVRGEFEREITPPIPQHPVDDRDIASLRISSPQAETELPRSVQGEETQWSDFYAYDDGVAAGSYDPAFAQSDPRAQSWAAPRVADGDRRAARGEPTYPHATFDEFGREEIAAAAREASPMVAADPRIMPHSREEQRAAALQAHEGSGFGLKIAVAAVVLGVLGGGTLAAWKYAGGTGSGEPVTIHADGKPLKSLPDPSKAPVADASPSLTTDNPKTPSKIVSLQEDPVDQVSGRTPEGKEIRLINPGAQRPSADTPHTVKTVVVRPDGSIVSDGATLRPARTPAPAAGGPVSAVPPVSALPPVAAQPPVSAMPPAAAPSTAGAPAPSAAVPMPSGETPMPMPKPAAPVASQAVPQVKTVAVTPVTVPKPAAPVVAPKPVATAPSTGAPMALGPVGPRLAATPPAAAPAPLATASRPTTPAPTAPVALAPPPSAGASGDYMVQLSASESDAGARASFAAAQRKHAGLAGKSLDIQKADLGAKGTFYRARVPAGSRDQAAALCSQIQSQGGQCMVVKR